MNSIHIVVPWGGTHRYGRVHQGTSSMQWIVHERGCHAVLKLAKSVMSRKGYYDILGVDGDASQREIKRAYRKMAMKYHPDRNPGDSAAEKHFKRAAEAYEVLGNPDKRSLYDQFGLAGLERSCPGRGAPDFSDVDDIFSEFNEIFGEMFGFGKRARGGKSPRKRRGADLRHDMDLSFEEAVSGTEKTIDIPRHTACEACNGTGARSGTEPQACESCDGEGQVQHTQGFFTLSSTCPDCGGAGEVIQDTCEVCDGRSYIEETREITVTVPAGVDTGTRLRLRQEGETGRDGGPRGDLYVFLNVQPSDEFDREGSNLHFRADINFAEAALGCEVEVPTLEGSTVVKFGPGTQFDDTKILENRGVEHLEKDGRGDLYVHANVIIPDELGPEERELIRQLRSLFNEGRSSTEADDEAAESPDDEDVGDVLSLEREPSDFHGNSERELQPPETRAVSRSERSAEQPARQRAGTPSAE